MTRRKFIVVTLLATVSITVCAQAETRPTLDELSRRAAIIKPSPSELMWQQIPWLTDLTAGLRVAKQERCPIFLWVTGDDPLERC